MGKRLASSFGKFVSFRLHVFVVIIIIGRHRFCCNITHFSLRILVGCWFVVVAVVVAVAVAAIFVFLFVAVAAVIIIVVAVVVVVVILIIIVVVVVVDMGDLLVGRGVIL